MKDNIVGYLCGALEVEETAEFERTLEGNLELKRHVETVRLYLTHLDCEREDCDPPEGLAAKCCEKLRQLRAAAKQRAK